MMQEKEPIGVIVGRFQVPSLHGGHKDLFNQVLEKHKKVYVFLGLSPLKCTINNPLDFESRKQMILREYPNVTVFYIKDVMDDIVWSNKLDEMIEDLLQVNQTAILYGSRDSFKEHYFGKFEVKEIEQKIFISGTEIRNKISSRIKSTTEFRKGVIWATQNRYPACIPTVDIAIFDNDYENLLLGRKKDELKYRFIGGFVSPKETYEQCVIREAYEETNLEIGGLKYLKSFFIDDWRFKNETDKITTSFFIGIRIFGRPQPGDDIYELRWFNKKELSNLIKNEKIVPNHIQLMEYLIEYLKEK